MAIAAPPTPPSKRSIPVAEPGLEVKRMSFDDFMRLPEKPKAEWLDGWVVIHVAPTAEPHAEMSFQLPLLFYPLVDLKGLTDGPFRLPYARFYPDIQLRESTSPGGEEKPPVLVVEILSPSTRRYDLSTKSTEYLAAGVGQFWTIDTKYREVIVRENALTEWRIIAIVDKDHPKAAIQVGDHGTVDIDFAKLFD